MSTKRDAGEAQFNDAGKIEGSDEFWSKIVSSHQILKGLENMGFSSPTPIQEAVIPLATQQKKDVIGAAETGSGKTLAFAIPILDRWLAEGGQMLAKDDVTLFALVIAPTRELAIQIRDVFKQLSAKIEPRPMRTIAIVGGMSEQKQQRLLKSRPDVVVATPGRLWALKQMGEEHLEDLSGLKMLIVDEIDRMLEQGHFEELRHIVQEIHNYRKEHLVGRIEGGASMDGDGQQAAASPQLQTLIFSATLTFTHHIPMKREEKAITTKSVQSKIDPKQKVRRIAQSMCMRKGANRLAVIDLTPVEKTPKSLIECRMNCMDLLQKDTNLFYLLRRYGGRTLVFGNSVSAIRRLQALLKKLTPMGGAGTLPRILHGRMKEKERLKSVERFEASPSAILLATDVAARGLDFHSVQNIIHYQAPKTTENYIHRSGRTARASKAGLSVLFVDPLDLPQYQKICQNMNRDEDLEVLAVDDEKLMGNCRKLMELATEAESLEHRLKKRKSREQWFKQLAKEADLVWDEEEDGAAQDGNDDEPGEEQIMGRRKKVVERALKDAMRTFMTPPPVVPSSDGQWNERKRKTMLEVVEEDGKEQIRKRLRLEKGAKKWFKRHHPNNATATQSK